MARFRLRSRRFQTPERQNVVPSQSLPHLTPYSNAVQIDVVQQRPLRGKKPEGYTRPEPYVITQFDARPINAIDFISTFTTTEQTAAVGTRLASFSIVNDPQRVLIIRQLQLSFWCAVVGTPVFNAATGAPQIQASASFLIDGSAVDRARQFRVDAAACDATKTNRLNLPFYFLVPPSATLQLQVSFALPVDATFAFVQPIITGNALFAEGVNPNSEPGTKCALPTWDARRAEQPSAIRPVKFGQ